MWEDLHPHKAALPSTRLTRQPHTHIFGFVIGIIPHFFSLGVLVHIYIPQTDTPCGEMSLSGRSYSLSWAFPLRVAFPHLCAFIIAHCERFVKSFLKLFSNFFQPLLDFLTHSAGFRFELYQPLTVLLLYHTLTYLSRVF